MTDNFIRHLVAAIGTIICGLAYFAGYLGGSRGWWWAGITIFGVYFFLYKLINAGGHGHH